MSKTYTHFLLGREWDELIENKQFEIVDQISGESLKKLNEKKCLFFQTSLQGSKIPYDRHRWSQTQKGDAQRHQPAYKKMVVQGCPLHSIRCTSVGNENFRKDIIHVANNSYFHYFLVGKGVYQEPEEGSVKKPRITDNVAERIRDLLKQGSSKDVYEMAKSEGLRVSRRQISS
ncbi:Recombinase domain-containing protein [Caenorhabditis elegans]|uniref:Recombinase domain-containing protein n=1 Tax=Caenorhabditis elegans TaxID=6239 RepID=B3CJ33_CAEEL|nr:Recombinase domain-containing protein [Caenorhabditis elegans]CCD68308.1 Recombinase domain-containing protein [Caenorhabditis elegans]|eukprot:NP_001129798.1 Uncharacterized protein CELE_Y119C1B.10 [Caenorhabditis elegans]